MQSNIKIFSIFENFELFSIKISLESTDDEIPFVEELFELPVAVDKPEVVIFELTEDPNSSCSSSLTGSSPKNNKNKKKGKIPP